MADHVVVAAKAIYAHVSRAMVGNELPARRMGLAGFETPLALYRTRADKDGKKEGAKQKRFSREPPFTLAL
jgi:hypothetical protein